jgi:hypothetical protein
LRLRRAFQRRASADVSDALSALALLRNRSIPLTRPLRGRPLPAGERYATSQWLRHLDGTLAS